MIGKNALEKICMVLQHFPQDSTAQKEMNTHFLKLVMSLNFGHPMETAD